jgi:hypothetical protein
MACRALTANMPLGAAAGIHRTPVAGHQSVLSAGALASLTALRSLRLLEISTLSDGALQQALPSLTR